LWSPDAMGLHNGDSANGVPERRQYTGTKYFCGALGPVLLAIVAAFLFLNRDLLSGFTENNSLGPASMQFAVGAFCLTGGYKTLIDETKVSDDHFDPRKPGTNFSVAKDGEIPEDQYEKASIYSLLYGAYRHAGIVKDTFGRPYRFSFNTWGVSRTSTGEVPFGPEFPQRPGMTAYYSLATMPAVVDLVKANPGAHFLEVGCGTGAGADLISRKVWPTINYTALDMQKVAIEQCVERHASHENPHLRCVQGNGQSLPLPDNSVDVLVVSETHIAEVQIGAEEKAIFAEMDRVLKPGGLFVWGNALPAGVWGEGAAYLQTVHQFESCGSVDLTDAAIEARDQDAGRVELFMQQLLNTYPVLSPAFPLVGQGCRNTLEMLIKNFFRHPGTDLYERMVVRADSYMNLCHRKIAKSEYVK